jgi:hypothetical protein
MVTSPPKVFVSYSHDSAEHKEIVLRFSERLRKDGIDAQIDQYVAGRPKGGWPRWMLDKLDWADFVLLVCTETYYRRFRGHEQPDRGKGVDWEGLLITLDIYNSKSRTTKFVPIIFTARDKAFIPEPLSDQFYCLDLEERYQELYSVLTGQAGEFLSELGPVRDMPKKEVEPLTFGDQRNIPNLRRPDQTGDRPSPKRTLGDELTSRESQQAPSKKAASNQERRKEISFYAITSLISFLCGLVVLGLMIWKADLLARLGLTGNLFYIALLPMGLASAGFLFGVVQAYTRYKGEQVGGTLELGGPIVAFLLVVILGFVLVKPVTTFPLTVYVHGPGGNQDIVLRNSGYVLLDLGGDRRRRAIDAEGQAYFHEIPANFLNEEVPISVESDTYEPARPDEKYRLNESSVYLSVCKKGCRISGRVQDENGNLLSNATVFLAGHSTRTDAAGHFEFVITGVELKPDLELQATKVGFLAKHFGVVPNSNDVVIQLTRAP